MTEQQKYWFAARTRDKQEFTVRKSLDRLKSEEDLDLDYYLPTRFVISQLKYRRKRSEVPVIRNLVFVHSTKQTACDISNIYNVPLFYMKDFSTHSMLVVPDKQMEDFMFVMDLNPDGVSLDSEILTVGHKVKVIKGELSGIEGEVAIEANKTYVVIRIKDLLTASTAQPGQDAFSALCCVHLLSGSPSVFRRCCPYCSKTGRNVQAAYFFNRRMVA